MSALPQPTDAHRPGPRVTTARAHLRPVDTDDVLPQQPPEVDDQPASPPADPLLTLQDVLTELAVPRATFYRWRQLGLAPEAIRLPNSQLRFRRSALDAWLTDHTEKPE